jgi:hypothetical protein
MKTSLYAATHNDCLTEKPIQIKIVCGGLCVLELLSARLAAADNEHHPECADPGRCRQRERSSQARPTRHGN